MADTSTTTIPKKEISPWQQENIERTKELTDKLEAGIQELFSSEKYKDYLKSMSHFHNYSSRNIMLIHQQMPTATRVASYKLWNEKFNRQVKKGESSLRIFAPIERKPETMMMEKLNPKTNTPMLDANGKVIMEEVTDSKSRVTFKLVPVFDVSQTHGDPLPKLAEDLTGNVAHYEAFLDTLKNISPLLIEFESLPPEQDGYCRYGEKIAIREGMSEIQTVSAIIHEITHARLHDRDKLAETDTPKSKDVKEIEAESVSYVVCQKYGIETGDNSFGYLASWSNHDMDEFKNSLDSIRKEANNLISAIDEQFMSICKERGIDLTFDEQAEPPQQAPTAETTAQPTTATKKMPEQASATESTELLPDPTINTSDRDTFGYTAEELLPLNTDRALELFNQDHTIYLLYPDNTEAMAFEAAEIETHDGIFGIEREDWQKTISQVDTEIEKTIEPYDASAEMAEYAQWQRKQDLLGADPPGTNIFESDEEFEITDAIDITAVPVYKSDLETARKNDELEDFHNSANLNHECGQAIDKAITESNYEQYRYDLKTAARNVIEEFGADRVARVVASNVNYHNFDGRLSSSNKDWAKGFDTPKPDVYLQTHLTVLDGFVDNFRKIEKEKPSLMAALNVGTKKSKTEFDGKAQPGLDAPDKDNRKKNTGMEV